MKRTLFFIALAAAGLFYTSCSQTEENFPRVMGQGGNPPATEASINDNKAFQGDSLALTAFFKSTNGMKWVRRIRWTSAAPLRTWYGVKVEEINGAPRVVELNLPANCMKGTLPDELRNLTALRKLNLSYNEDLTGSLPEGLFEMKELKVLNLRFCSFTGELSKGIGNLVKLDTLDFWTFIPDLQTKKPYPYRMSGQLPEELGNLTNARYIRLARHSFSGPLPSTLGNLKSVTFLDLSQCELSGSIPQGFRNMEKLQYLNLAYNRLTGSIPEDICQAPSLTHIYLRYNQLEGKIPAEIGNERLRHLVLSHNKLSGEIPPSLSKASDLGILSLDNNQLEGEIPSWLGNNNPYLIDAELTNNNLTGQMPVLKGRYIPGAGTTYTVFHVSGNRLSGELPDCYTRFIPYNVPEMGLPRYIPQQKGYGFSNLPKELPN